MAVVILSHSEKCCQLASKHKASVGLCSTIPSSWPI